MSSGFASRCESRFFIAELCRFATRLTSQALERQDVWLVRLLQYDVSIAFGEMSFGRNAARGLADGCPAHCERLRRLLFDHRTSKCVSVTIAEFLGDSSIDRQNGLRRRSSTQMIALVWGLNGSLSPRSSDLVVERHGPTLTDRAAKSSAPVLAGPRIGERPICLAAGQFNGHGSMD